MESACRKRHGVNGRLDGGWSACGKTWRDERRRKSWFLEFDLHAHLRERWCAMVRLRMVDRLVTQMADRAIRVGAGMMMRDAAQDHHEHQQREERYWNDEIPDWLAFMHVVEGGRNPEPYHIRRWLLGANGLRLGHLVYQSHSRLCRVTGSKIVSQR